VAFHEKTARGRGNPKKKLNGVSATTNHYDEQLLKKGAYLPAITYDIYASNAKIGSRQKCKSKHIQKKKNQHVRASQRTGAKNKDETAGLSKAS
jgi:hypothetical protein